MTLLEKDITNPDPDAPYINWTKKKNGAVYYDARDSKYYAVLVDKDKVYPTNQASYLLLGQVAAQNFLIDQEVNYATATERKNLIFDHIVKLAGYHVPTMESLPNKIRFSITPENYKLLIDQMAPRAGTNPESGTDLSQDVRWITIDPSQYDTMFENLVKTLDVVGRAYECAFRNGTYNVPNLRFGTRINKVKKFQAKLKDILSNALGSSWEKNSTSLALRQSFTKEKPSFDQVWIKNVLEEWIQVKTGAKNMGKKDPFNDMTTVNFVLNAPQIARDFLSDKPKDYKTFIEQYYVPTPQFPQADPLDPLQGASTLLGAFGSNGTGAASCASNFVGSFLETVPGNQVSGQLTKYSDCVEQLDSSTYYDRTGRNKLKKVLDDPRLSSRRVADALMTTVDEMDPIVEQLKINIEESKDLKDLYINVLDPLGVDGFAKLLASGLLLQIKCLTLDAVVKQVCLSALEVTTKVQIYELYKNVVWEVPTSEGLTAPMEFSISWESYSGFAPPIPPLDEVSPATFTAPPKSNIPAEKPQLSIGIPSLSTDPTVPMIRTTFINMVQEDLVSPYEMIKEILNTPLTGDAGVLGIVLGIDSGYAQFKLGKVAPITMPYIPPIIIPSLGDVTKLAIQFAKQALERAATAIAKTLMISVLDAIFSLCDDPAAAGNILGSTPGAMVDILRGEICSPRATNYEVAQATKELLDSFSVWEVSSPSERPNAGDVQMFAERVSTSTSPQQMINLFNGTASEGTVRQVSEAVQSMSNNRVKNALASDAAIENLFASLGTLINRNALQAQHDLAGILNTPTDPQICADPFQIVAEDEATRAALLAKGLNDDQIAEQMKAATERALEKLSDTAKTLFAPAAAMGAQSGMPIKETANGPVINPVSTDPTKDDGLFPMQDESTKDFNSQLFNSAYDSLDNMVMQDLMIGNPLNMFSKGFLDMILSANNGRGYTRIAGEIHFDKENEKKFYSKFNKETPPQVSDLYDVFKSPSDFVEVTSENIIATYSKPEEPPSTGTTTSTTSPPITKLQYQLGGPLFIDYNASSGESLEYSININYAPSPAAQDVITLVSPSSNAPRNILANWCANALDDYLQYDESSTTERSVFIEGTRQYVADTFHRQIIDNVLGEYFKKSVDTIGSSNYDAWEYGNREPKEPEIVELEDDQGSFYVKACTQDYKGWMNVYDNAIPLSAAPTREVPLFNFVDIKEECQKYYDTVPEDLRMQATALMLKKYSEPPFSRINTRINNAMLAGISSAVSRLSLYDALIKGSPFFRLYAMNKENYGDLFLSYMIDSVIEEVLDESLKMGTISLKPLGVQGYYYLFLEQVVQSYSNMINTGLVAGTADGTQALRFLNEKLQQNWKLDIKRINRTAKFKDFIDTSLPQIKIILGEIISVQMEKVTETTRRVFSPKAESLNRDIMEKWLEGGTKESNFGHNPPGPLAVPVNLSDFFMKSGDLDFPFVLQKYIRLVNAGGKSQVVNADELDEDLISKNVEFFFGTRIALAMPLDYINEFGSKTQSYIKSTLTKQFNESRSFITKDEDGNTRYLIPLFSKEIESTDTEITGASPQFDLNEMILASGEFEALFKNSIPMSGLLSFATIYTIENFVESLAIKERDQGFQAFRFWNGDTFAMSREYLRKMAQQAYYARSAEYINQIAIDLSAPIVTPNAALGIGKSALEAKVLSKLPKWKRKKKRPAPPDVCED